MFIVKICYDVNEEHLKVWKNAQVWLLEKQDKKLSLRWSYFCIWRISSASDSKGPFWKVEW